MNRKDITYLQEKLSVLIGQPLQNISRVGGTVFIEIGSIIEKKSLYRNKDGYADVKKEKSGKYVLHIECNSRFSLGNRIIIGKYDMYKPTIEMKKELGFDEESFEWDVLGNNCFDKNVKTFFNNFSHYIVNKIIINKFGDLKILFTNYFIFEIFIDTSGSDECWRFIDAENINIKHIVVSGNGFTEE